MRILICDICGMTFTDPIEYMNHIEKEKEKEEEYNEDGVGSEFDRTGDD